MCHWVFQRGIIESERKSQYLKSHEVENFPRIIERKSTVVKKKNQKSSSKKCLGGSVVECLPLAQGVILESQDRVPHRALYGEPASPSACVSASVSLLNK